MTLEYCLKRHTDKVWRNADMHLRPEKPVKPMGDHAAIARNTTTAQLDLLDLLVQTETTVKQV